MILTDLYSDVRFFQEFRSFPTHASVNVVVSLRYIVAYMYTKSHSCKCLIIFIN